MIVRSPRALIAPLVSTCWLLSSPDPALPNDDCNRRYSSRKPLKASTFAMVVIGLVSLPMSLGQFTDKSSLETAIAL